MVITVTDLMGCLVLEDFPAIFCQVLHGSGTSGSQASGSRPRAKPRAPDYVTLTNIGAGSPGQFTPARPFQPPGLLRPPFEPGAIALRRLSSLRHAWRSRIHECAIAHLQITHPHS